MMKGWVIFVLAFAIYFVSLFGGFVQDDVKVISGDLELGGTKALLATWTRPYYYADGNDFSVYRPVTTFSFYLNAIVTGKEAWGFRLGNVLIYAWVCWLIYKVLLKWTSESGAFWGAMVFTVLPIHTEVVNNIVGRSEMLSLGLFLLAMLRILDKKWEFGTMFLFLALLSKETALVGVPILLFLIWTNRGVEKNEKIGAGFLTVMAFAGFLLIRLVVLGGLGMGNAATMVENPLKFVETQKRVMNAVGLIPFGVGKVIFPVNLSYDYSYNQIKLIKEWWNWKVILGLGMIGISLLSLLKNDWRRNQLPVIGLMLFWGPILITGNLLFPIGTIFGERLWFWSSLGVVFLIAAIGSNRVVLAKTSAPIIIAILFLYAGRTVVRNFDWLSQERLFVHDAMYASGSVMAQNNAAAMYLLKQNLPVAKETMEKANEIYPQYPELLNNWGMYFLMTGEAEEAKKKFEECLLARPGNQLCQGNLDLLKEKRAIDKVK